MPKAPSHEEGRHPTFVTQTNRNDGATRMNSRRRAVPSSLRWPRSINECVAAVTDAGALVPASRGLNCSYFTADQY
jgi:hypothetical protein